MNIKRTLIFLFTGLISIASLSLSMSIAWFATSTRLFVETFDIDIRGERELTISTSEDVDSFKSKLVKEELNGVGLFMPVSSMFSSKWENEENPIPSFYEYGNSYFFPKSGIPYGPEKSTRGFFQQELYLLGDDDLFVSLDTEETYFKSNIFANRTAAEAFVKDNPNYTQEEVYEGMNDLVNALRVSIYDVSEKQYYIVDPNKSGDTYYGGTLDNDNDKYFDVYEDENGELKEVLYGEVTNRENAVYEDVGDEDILVNNEKDYSVFVANHKKNTKRFLKEESLSSGLSFKKEPSLSLEEIDTYNIHQNKLVLELKYGQPKKIIVSIYLEGWDESCINRTMGGTFFAQLQFKILREM